MSHSFRRIAVVGALTLLPLTVLACGGNAPEPKTEDTPKEDAPRPRSHGAGGPTVGQELGSIDQRAVEQTFSKLQAKLETCHTQGRGRVDVLAGDVKLFLRIGGDGKVRYSYFEESTLGDRATEKCILELLGATDWPKPIGGEAEVRNGFGWSAGGERPPAPWEAEKVMTALDEDRDVKKAVDACKAGASGDFRVTAYVEPGEIEPPPAPEAKPGKKDMHGKKPPGKDAKKGPDKKGADKTEKKEREHGGKFKSLGVAPPSKEAAEKVDCVVDAMKNLSLPSPGGYLAKVTFSL